MKRGLVFGIGVFLALALLSLYVFRVSENRVIVQRMIDFTTAEPNSDMEWTDRGSIGTFEYAVRFAKKERGMVDIAAPPYSFTLGDSHYLLWIAPQYELAQFMKADKTGILYTVSPSLTEKLKALLSQADERFGDAQAGFIGGNGGEEGTGKAPDEPVPPGGVIAAPIGKSPSSTAVVDQESVYLEESNYSVEQQPLIHLINLRVKYMHDRDQKSYLALYAESAPIDRTLSADFPYFTIYSNEIDGEISIQEQKSLFQGVIRVLETRSDGNNGSKTYVFHKGKEADSDWLIADVD